MINNYYTSKIIMQIFVQLCLQVGLVDIRKFLPAITS